MLLQVHTARIQSRYAASTLRLASDQLAAAARQSLIDCGRMVVENSHCLVVTANWVGEIAMAAGIDVVVRSAGSRVVLQLDSRISIASRSERQPQMLEARTILPMTATTKTHLKRKRQAFSPNVKLSSYARLSMGKPTTITHHSDTFR